MVSIAIPGGTGKIGLTIAEELRKNPKHKVVVLSRKAPETNDPNAPVVAVDYTDIDALTQVLETHAIHTVVSALQVLTPESGVAEVNLAKAAVRSRTTQRFISSDYGAPVTDPRFQLPFHPLRLATLSFLATTSLEYSTIHVGQISDFLGTPHLASHMGVYAIHVDVAHRAASLPGTGDDPMLFTYSRDIARFVGAAVDLPAGEWAPAGMWCYGSRNTLNDVVRMAEEARGVKFTVVHDPEEMLERGEMTVLPLQEPLIARMGQKVALGRATKFGLATMHGLFSVPDGAMVLNERFPEIKPMTMGDVVAAWRGK